MTRIVGLNYHKFFPNYIKSCLSFKFKSLLKLISKRNGDVISVKFIIINHKMTSTVLTCRSCVEFYIFPLWPFTFDFSQYQRVLLLCKICLTSIPAGNNFFPHEISFYLHIYIPIQQDKTVNCPDGFFKPSNVMNVKNQI